MEEAKEFRPGSSTLGAYRGLQDIVSLTPALHYGFDLWAQAWRQKRAQGDMIIVRFADDIVLGFQEKSDAEQFRVELTERMRKFNLELASRENAAAGVRSYAIDHRQWRGGGKPETFDFLGFTHICVKKRNNGRLMVLRQTIRKRLQAKLNAVKAELRLRMHEPIPEQGSRVVSAMYTALLTPALC